MSPRSCSDLSTLPTDTPRISSISARPIGWRYAMRASVSSAAALSRAGRAASSSLGIGRALANSAASSSFASGVTCDLHVGKGAGLLDTTLAELRHLEQSKQGREDLPRLGARGDELGPARTDSQREQVADERDRARHVDGA